MIGRRVSLMYEEEVFGEHYQWGPHELPENELDHGWQGQGAISDLWLHQDLPR